ncbi:MAG: hypothetical protein NW224_12650 [Leptolyngbyaceae cyanobacterium bins.302]|nr:hypothetical protein [Leptolyngbyaceae cyanobacterium bins.302]
MPENGHHSSQATSATSPTPPPTTIDPDEAARLAGYQPEQPEQLLETEYRLVQEQEGGDTRPVHESPFPRMAAVALPVGLLFLAGTGIWFGLLAPSSKRVPEVATAPTPVPTLSPDDSAELKSQLAFQQQQVKAEGAEPKSKSTPVKRQERERRERREPRRVIRSEPPEPRVIERFSPPRERPVPVVRTTQLLPKAELIDPFARWNQLAQLGQQQTDNTEESVQTADSSIPSAATTQQIVEAATGSGVIPTVRIGFEPKINPVQQSSSDFSTDEILELPALNNSVQLASRRLIAPSNNATQQRILNERSLDSEPMQVAIGTTVPATVVVPMLASEETKPGLGRFTVELTEDVIATDGRIALPKGTLLITEVNRVEQFTGHVDQSAVAIVYKDWGGNTRQQQVPANSLLVRGAQNEPLIAQAFEDGAGIVAGQDLLVGGLNALGKVGELLNQPDEESFSSFDAPFSNGQAFSRKRRSPNILGAALEGFFGVTADRLRKRADTITEQQYSRPKLMVVQQGQSVSVVFNTFFEIQR